jgi:hypothetical protein
MKHPSDSTLPSPVTAQGAEEALTADLAQLYALLARDAIEAARVLIRELQEKWPDSDRVQHYARVLAPPGVRIGEGGEGTGYKAERAWLRQHARDFPDCWLAVHGDHLVAASTDPQEVERQLALYPQREEVLLHFQPDTMAGCGR